MKGTYRGWAHNPDNLKSGINKACRYEPDINPTYQQMALHYRCVVIPARIKKAKDKAKVEAGVKIVEQWILARLRNIKFFSLHDLNKTINNLLLLAHILYHSQHNLLGS